MEGIAVGILGIEGMLGSGGKVTFGTAGRVAKLGSGGRVGLGWVVGKVGNVGWGRFGIVGNGGSVGIGKLGIEGKGGNCKRLRAAKLISMLENDKAVKKARMKLLKEATIQFASAWWASWEVEVDWGWAGKVERLARLAMKAVGELE
ncbi:hypothetical protein GH714_008146 [Hevea brasiliensis]|uniref:Uncharacterized protein n=1 Tax=Hevea brasiliensis TaxID=3981 RepID=A0A6A6L1M9_HEVBR|nr:hypothetical protein GH714_008146 [Hevea brasiliensis]